MAPRKSGATARATVRKPVQQPAQGAQPQDKEAEKRPEREVRVHRLRYIGKKPVKHFVTVDGTEYSVPKGGSVMVPEEHAAEMLRHPDVFKPWTKDTLPAPLLAIYERAVARMKRAAAVTPAVISEDPHAPATRAELQAAVRALSERISVVERKLGIGMPEPDEGD